MAKSRFGDVIRTTLGNMTNRAGSMFREAAGNAQGLGQESFGGEAKPGATGLRRDLSGPMGAAKAEDETDDTQSLSQKSQPVDANGPKARTMESQDGGGKAPLFTDDMSLFEKLEALRQAAPPKKATMGDLDRKDQPGTTYDANIPSDRVIGGTGGKDVDASKVTGYGYASQLNAQDAKKVNDARKNVWGTMMEKYGVDDLSEVFGFSPTQNWGKAADVLNNQTTASGTKYAPEETRSALDVVNDEYRENRDQLNLTPEMIEAAGLDPDDPNFDYWNLCILNMDTDTNPYYQNPDWVETYTDANGNEYLVLNDAGKEAFMHDQYTIGYGNEDVVSQGLLTDYDSMMNYNDWVNWMNQRGSVADWIDSVPPNMWEYWSGNPEGLQQTSAYIVATGADNNIYVLNDETGTMMSIASIYGEDTDARLDAVTAMLSYGMAESYIDAQLTEKGIDPESATQQDRESVFAGAGEDIWSGWDQGDINELMLGHEGMYVVGPGTEGANYSSHRGDPVFGQLDDVRQSDDEWVNRTMSNAWMYDPNTNQMSTGYLPMENMMDYILMAYPDLGYKSRV